MGASQRNCVPNGGPTAEGSALLSLLNFVESSLDDDPEPLSISTSFVHTDGSDHDGYPLVKEAKRSLCPKSPMLRLSTLQETNETTSLPEISLGPSSLDSEFPCSLQPSAAGTKAAGKRSAQISSSGTSRTAPQKWYLHRAPSGKLTVIPPSPLCQEVTKSLLEEAEERPDHGVIYAGYRIFSEDPREYLGLVSGLEKNEYMKENKDIDVVADVETSLDDPPCFPFPSEDDTGYSSSESSTVSLSMRRDFRSGLKSLSSLFLRPKLTAVQEDSLLEAPIVLSPETIRVVDGPIKQTRHVAFSIPDSRPKTSDRFFNPLLKQKVESEERQAQQPTPSDVPDAARIQFKSRRGPLWNWVNKQLERLYLHSVNLSESEFVELSCCAMKDVQAWLDEHSPHIIRRSMERWMNAHSVLKNAGIKPSELNESVLDIFEWMTQQEQADFIKAYQRLYAIVMASQEGLHLTQWEMDHFSRLSLADKIDFIEEYKDRREQRERIVRRDTTNFTAKLRRIQRDQDEFPFANCSELEFLHCRTGLAPKGRKVSQDPITTVADNFHVKHLQCGMGQKKSEDTSTISTYVRIPNKVSAAKPDAESQVNSALEQHRRRITIFTGDGRFPHSKCDGILPIQEAAEIDKVSEETQNSITTWDSYSSPKECFINIDKLLTSDSDEATETAKGTPLLKTYAEAAKLEERSNGVNGKTFNNCVQDCGRLSTSLLSVVPQCESIKKSLSTVETDNKAAFEILSSIPVVERSFGREWHGEHPGAKLPYPTPPPTELSADGVISPINLVNDKPSTNLCNRDVTPVVDNTQTLPATKSKPCTPCHQTRSTSREPSIGHVTPPRPPSCTIRGLPSAYVSENDLRKLALVEKSPEKPKSLRKKVSTLWGSLRSKKNRDALKDLKYF